MSWKEQVKKQPGRKNAHAAIEGKPVRSLSEISPHATPDEVFRIEVEVVRIVEQETRSGQPCYFLACKDEKEARFSVVVWEAQMDEIKTLVAEGKIVTLKVRVPKEGYSAFTIV